MKPQITYQLWQQYNESGKTENIAFDFKGNLLSKQQQVISNTVLKTALDNYQTYLVDWTGLPTILGTQIFEMSSEYDALNRVTKITLPENVNSERKAITPTYNRAGALEKVSYDSTEYVENIAYNAKGQRLLIAFGNDIMTRYAYDNLTFRLLRQRSEKYTKTQTGNIISYTPQSGTNKQDDGFNFDLVGNILKTLIRINDCGISGTALGSDALDRNFAYDPMYRITSADGRESDTQHENDYLYTDAPVPGNPNANNVRAYERKYNYDKLGNIQQVKQLGTNGFTRDFSYNTDKNSLDTVSIGSNNYNYTYDACGNQLTENTERHFEWDAGNRLILFKNQVGSSEPSVIAQYLYDSSGNRVKKIIRKQGGSYEIRTYIDSVFEHFTDETEEQNTVHIMDDQSRVATVRIGDAMGDTTPAIKYNLENNIYSSTVVLDDTGTLVNSQEYYPFGETSFGSYGKKRYQYVGKERDEESGLYYYGARYFSPWIARFISCDPLSAKYAQLSPYNYSDNNPINDYDIDGMQNNNSQASETSHPPAAKADALFVVGPQHYEHIPEKKATNVVPPGEKSANWDKEAWNKYTKRLAMSDNMQVLAPDGNYYTFSKEKLSFTYSDGTVINYQQKKEGVWSVRNSEGQFMWNNVKGKYVKNTSGIGAGKNSMPIFGFLGTTYAGGGNNPVDYSQPPQNMADAAGMRHDLAYDKLKIAGDEGVKKAISTPANMKLIEESQAIIEKYKKGEIDPYTGAPISVRTVLTAWAMKFGFQKIEDVKSKIEKVKAIENSFINQGIRAFSRGYY